MVKFNFIKFRKIAIKIKLISFILLFLVFVPYVCAQTWCLDHSKTCQAYFSMDQNEDELSDYLSEFCDNEYRDTDAFQDCIAWRQDNYGEDKDEAEDKCIQRCRDNEDDAVEVFCEEYYIPNYGQPNYYGELCVDQEQGYFEDHCLDVIDDAEKEEVRDEYCADAFVGSDEYYDCISDCESWLDEYLVEEDIGEGECVGIIDGYEICADDPEGSCASKCQYDCENSYAYVTQSYCYSYYEDNFYDPDKCLSYLKDKYNLMCLQDTCYDRDGDGYFVYWCGGSDCNDNNALINPDTVWYLDNDGDGYYSGTTYTGCSPPYGNYVLENQIVDLTVIELLTVKIIIQILTQELQKSIIILMMIVMES